MTHKVIALIPKDDISRDFLIARAMAISHYAMLENSLSRLYSHLMGVAEDIAGIAFFRINNARSRSAILERLLKKKYGDTYNLFWNSLEKHLRNLDGTRNNVVHWATETYMNVDLPPGQQVTSLKLAPPNFWDKTENTSDMTIDALYDFIVKCDFFTRSINVFILTISGTQKVSQIWRDICLQPINYPPPDNHPLSLK